MFPFHIKRFFFFIKVQVIYFYHDSPTRGSPTYIIQPAATFGRYVCTIKSTQSFWRLGIPLTAICSVLPANQPAIAGVALCHKRLGDPSSILLHAKSNNWNFKILHQNKNNGHRIFRTRCHTKTDFQVTALCFRLKYMLRLTAREKLIAENRWKETVKDRRLNAFNYGVSIKRNLLQVMPEFLPHSGGNLHYLWSSRTLRKLRVSTGQLWVSLPLLRSVWAPARHTKPAHQWPRTKRKKNLSF